MSDAAPPIRDPAVAKAFAAFPRAERAHLLKLRRLIFDTAATTPGVGPLQESLKWGQPAYLTPQTRSGSTIRLGVPKGGGCALYAHCQTTIVSDFRALFPQDFAYEGNRAVLIDPAKALPRQQLGLLIAAALTYRLRRQSPGRTRRAAAAG